MDRGVDVVHPPERQVFKSNFLFMIIKCLCRTYSKLCKTRPVTGRSLRIYRLLYPVRL